MIKFNQEVILLEASHDHMYAMNLGRKFERLETVSIKFIVQRTA